ncbi:MAG: MarR family transcriptional regulator [Deltaproteobacteria bacterium]|nr:MarR family transcriptional regulator [Deltaproteobacteria bacterium]
MTQDNKGTSRPSFAKGVLGVGIAQQLRPLAQGLSRLDAARKSSFGPGGRAILDCIHEAERPIGAAAVVRMLFLDRQPVQRTLERLRANGLVERLENPDHLRVPLFKLTKKGTSELEKVHEAEAEVLGAMLAPFTNSELEACARLLLHLRIELSVREQGPSVKHKR